MDEEVDEKIERYARLGLYALAIGVNAWYLFEMYHDTPASKVWLAKMSRARKKIMAPFEERRRWVRAKTEVLLEAWRIVEEV